MKQIGKHLSNRYKALKGFCVGGLLYPPILLVEIIHFFGAENFAGGCNVFSV